MYPFNTLYDVTDILKMCKKMFIDEKVIFDKFTVSTTVHIEYLVIVHIL